MDIKVKKLPKSQIQLTIEFNEEDLLKHRKEACERISKEAKIPGFRQGKAPYEVLAQKYGKELIDAETKDIAVQKTFIKAATENDLHVLSRPESKIVSQEPFKIEITFATMPEVEVTGYEKIKVPMPEIKITEKEIKEVLDYIQRQNATFKDVERELKKGDRAEIEMQGFDGKDGPELDKVKSKNHPVVIGDGMFVPGFEDNLIGLKKGDKKEFELTFPKDYHDKSFQNKKVYFKVTVNRTEERTMPKWDDELVEKASGKKQTLDEFKKEIEADLTTAKTNEEKEKRKEKYFEELVKKVKAEIPEQLIEEEAHLIIRDLKQQTESRGIPWEKYLEMTKQKEEDMVKDKLKDAEKRVKTRLGLREIFKKEELDCTDSEVSDEIKKIKANYPKEQHKEIEKFYKKGTPGYNQLMNKLIMDKFFAKVLPE